MFERNSYFWKKQTLIFTVNLISQDCAPLFVKTSPALKNSWLLVGSKYSKISFCFFISVLKLYFCFSFEPPKRSKMKSLTLISSPLIMNWTLLSLVNISKIIDFGVHQTNNLVITLTFWVASKQSFSSILVIPYLVLYLHCDTRNSWVETLNMYKYMEENLLTYL